MHVKQLGNGGAFDFRDTNSSFLVSVGNNTDLLFDCGYSVYQKIREEEINGNINLKQLKHVFISHMDDDHMGSLKTLILFMFFSKGISLNIHCPKTIYNQLKSYLSDIVGVMDNGVIIPTEIYKLTWLSKTKIEETYIEAVEAYHNKDTAGLYFNSIDKLDLFISGDTIAHKSIESFISSKNKKVVIFHDFSNWDCPEKQIHACKKNIDAVYSKDFAGSLNYYHDNNSFEQKWIDLELEHKLKVF